MTDSNKTIQIRKYMPYLLATAIFMQMMDATVLNTALPAIAKDLNESPLDMQSAILSYVLTLALFIPVSGYLADRFGTKKIFMLALVLFSLGSIFCAMSTNLFELNISRIFQGIGGSLMTPVAKLALIKTYKRSELVTAMNYAIIPALIAPVIGPLIGGYLVEWASWHWIFLINIPIGLIGVIGSLKFMPDYTDKSTRFDLIGFIIFGLASIVLSLAFEWVGNLEYALYVIVAFAVGMALLYSYFIWAKKSDKALFPIDLFKVRTFRVGIVGNLFTRLGIGAIPLLVPLLIQVAYGESASTAGWIVSTIALASIFMKPYLVPVIDRFGYRNILRWNTVLLGILIMTIAIPSLDVNVYWFIPLMMIMGVLNSVQFTAMNSISLSKLRDNQTSPGNSLLAVNQQLSIGFGIASGLAILRLFQSNVLFEIENVHQAFRWTFILVGFLTILSSFIFSRLHPLDGENLKSTN